MGLHTSNRVISPSSSSSSSSHPPIPFIYPVLLPVISQGYSSLSLDFTVYI
ncbi:hypothetical protein DCAR_0209152 [Daucus carota subsp. sativus]|uniref:Uncharacterized protein n=1 Tax=Daucus carota subsp. sativus TaxID=79200 RepID=A0A166F2M0_DAUCS|nr:hypothetical protein DCAR_0209152 [Daucus carota subsp. sativus]